MTLPEFAAQYRIVNTEFPWLDRLTDACIDLYGATDNLTLKQYLTAWGQVQHEASKRLGKNSHE